MRIQLGLPPATSFSDINPDPDIQSRFATAYATVDDVDLWMGGLGEPHRAGALVGETFFVILKEQFHRLRTCDRFWYENYLPPFLSSWIDRQTLSSTIRRNTRIGKELQANVFIVPEEP